MDYLPNNECNFLPRVCCVIDKTFDNTTPASFNEDWTGPKMVCLKRKIHCEDSKNNNKIKMVMEGSIRNLNKSLEKDQNRLQTEKSIRVLFEVFYS